MRQEGHLHRQPCFLHGASWCDPWLTRLAVSLLPLPSQYSYSTQGYQAPVAPEGGDNGGYYTTAPGGYAAPVAGGYGAPVAGAADYQTTEYQTAGVSAAPPVYAQTGYAAVNAFNTYSTAAAAPVGQNAGQQFQGQQV